MCKLVQTLASQRVLRFRVGTAIAAILTSLTMAAEAVGFLAALRALSELGFVHV
jgi:hypothetical protein